MPPSGSGCLSPERDGLQLAISVQSFVLCAGLAMSEVRAGFSRGSDPTVWFASPSQFAQIALTASRPDSYSRQCSLCLPAQPLLASGGSIVSVLLLCWGSYHWARNLWVLINYLFFPPCSVALSASKALHRLGSESVSRCLETSLFKTPFPGQSSICTSFVSFFLSFIVFPTSFGRQ